MLVFQKSQSHSQYNESDLVNSLQRYCFLPTSASFCVKIYQNWHFFADKTIVMSTKSVSLFFFRFIYQLILVFVTNYPILFELSMCLSTFFQPNKIHPLN